MGLASANQCSSNSKIRFNVFVGMRTTLARTRGLHLRTSVLAIPPFSKKKKPFAQYEAACRVNEENKFIFFSEVWNISIVTVFNRFLEYV